MEGGRDIPTLGRMRCETIAEGPKAVRQPKPPRREQAKQERRERILDAAESLVEQSASTDFSMQRLAKHAGLSPFTTYNLIGSKATVLYALLNRSIDRMDMAMPLANPPKDPIERMFDAGDVIVDVYVARPDLYRPLLRYLFGVVDTIHRPAFMDRAYRYWHTAVQPLADRGRLRAGITPIDLARDMQMFFTGTLEYWVVDEISDAEFRAQIRHGFSLRLLALDMGDANQPMLDNISITRPIIEGLVARTLLHSTDPNASD